MSDAAQAVADYGAAWETTDAGARRALLERCWAEDGIYQDPTAEVCGRAALDAHIARFFAQMPGCRIVLTSGVQVHHDKVHFTWKMTGPDGETRMAGRDFGAVDGEGRLVSITGFFGEPPTG